MRSGVERLEKLVSSMEVRRAFGGISDMTLWRWMDKKILPQPVRINGRRYWRKRDIEELQQKGRAKEPTA